MGYWDINIIIINKLIASFQAETPQRLYCCIKSGEFRVAGAFTVDKQYL